MRALPAFLLFCLAAVLVAQPAPVLIDTIPPAVEISVPAGSFNRFISVEFKTSEPATVYYTLDNSAPTEQSLRFSGVLSLSEEGSVVLRYMAIDLVGNRSKEYRQEYLFDTQAPRLMISPPSGKFGNALQVKVTSTEQAEIYYTLDNTLPTIQSPPYRNALNIAASCTLKAVGLDRLGNMSEVVSAAYRIDTRVPVVNISPEAGIYNKPTKVVFSAPPDVKVFYSLDEFASLISYSVYTGPLLLKSGQTVISFFGENGVGTRSDPGKRVYIVDMSPPKVDAITKDMGDRRGVMVRANEKAAFYYTLDGSPPSDKSIPYKGPIYIPKKGVVLLRVYARDAAGNASDDFQQKFSYDVTPPRLSASPAPGLYNRPLTVRITANEPVRIFYTLDNTVPTDESPVFSDSLDLTREGRTVLTFFGVDNGDNRSELQSLVYNVDKTPPNVRPRIQRNPENKEFTISFTLAPDERLLYTTDGSDPGPMSREYRGEFNVAPGTTVKYTAADAAGNRIEVRTITEVVVPNVVATPAGGVFNRVTRVQLVANLPGRIFYRTESKRQEKGDFLEYADPIMLNANGLYKIEFYSTDMADNQSSIREESYLVDLFPPEIEVYTTRNPVESTIIVNFQASENATIYYTVDGSNPFSSPTAQIIGNKYFRSRDKIVFKHAAKDLQITFLGEDVAGNRSELYQFDINLPTVVANPPGGQYNRILNVALTTYNEATVYFTLDGSAPTEYSPIYRNPVPVTRNTIVKYFAIDGFGYRGKTGESRYVIDLPPRPEFEVLSDSLIEGLKVFYSAAPTVDEESDSGTLQFQWDLNGDGKWDTEWGSDPKASAMYRTPGVRRVALRARDPSGQIAAAEKNVNILKNCPRDMVSLNEGERAYCMDRYEYPNVKGALPMTGVTWVEAEMRCRSMGKELCTQSEWRTACRGRAGGAYPYGADYAPDSCNTATRALSGAGKFPGCGSDQGIYDLTGNAWEWVADRRDGYNLIAGGNYYYGKNARCDATFTNLLSKTDPAIGFRCCK